MNTMAEPGPPVDLGLTWRNRFAALGPAFSTPWRPTPLPAPYWVGRSRALARELGLPPGALDSEDALQALSGNADLAGSDPRASVYSGHQFGVWAGQLGDGRAVLLGEVLSPAGESLELQLKGSGRTPYSRMGDGRAVLRSSIREFLCSEAMHALGIPTSRALCVTGSDAPVRRETIETAAVVTRVAPSFIRFGHFEHFAHSGALAQLRTLADFVIDRFYPDCRAGAAPEGNVYAALLEAVAARTAAMVAQWQAVGFCHGVMNTDNMSILGLTVDYGPFQFLDAFDPGHVCNHSDTQGRYAFQNQPNVAYWNLYCLGEALLPLIGTPERTVAALTPYRTAFPGAFLGRMRAKLGWLGEQTGDGLVLEALLQRLAADRVDYPLFWRRLAHHVAGGPLAPLRDLFLDRAAFDTWLSQFNARSPGDTRAAQGQRMLRANPAYVLRNHLGELAIRSAKLKDFSEVERLLAVLEHPFEEQPGCAAYADFPPDWASSIEISCSS